MSLGAKITLITGVPGAGKTAAGVEVLQGYIDEGRKVYTYGLASPAFEHEPLADPHKWHEPGVVEDGSVIFIDEAQDVWPPAAPGAKIPPDLYELARHRHRGITFILTTQAAGMLHSRVRDLCGQFILIRNLGPVLGRRWYEWPECPKSILFKQAPIQRKYKLPKRVFSLYKSSSLHVKQPASIPPSLIVLGLAVVALVALAWFAYSSISSKVEDAQKPSARPGASGQAQPANPAPGQVTLAPGAPGAPGRTALFATPAQPGREPYSGFGVHLAGVYTVGQAHRWLFSLTREGRAVATVRLEDLTRAGYAWRPLAACVGVLAWRELERVVVCDAPAGDLPGPQAPPAAPVSPPASSPLSGAFSGL